MELRPLKSWKLEFARSVDAASQREIMRKFQDEVRRKDQRDEERKDRQDGALEHMTEIVVMASSDQLANFEVTLDQYDTATYEALLENEQLLDAIRLKIDDMLGKAYELPDGRRVFETEDGLRVFDEFGNELDASEITPEEIEDWRPKWEPFRAGKESELHLTEERTDIIDYQLELDEAHQLVKEGKISEDALHDVEAKVTEDMPERVREHLPSEFRPMRELAKEITSVDPAANVQSGVNFGMPEI